MGGKGRDKNDKTMELIKNRLWFGGFLGIFLATLIAGAQLPREVTAPAPGPLTGRVICLDPGHGGYDGGARAPLSGLWEKQLNLETALEARKALEARGAKVILTRERDQDLTDQAQGATLKRRDMNARLAIAGEADVLVSVHMNEYRQASVSGPQVFYLKASDPSRLLAGCLQESLIKTLSPPKERSAQAGDYYILKLPIPAALVECGFLSNPREEELLRSRDYQARVGEAIARGITEFFELQSRANVLQ